MQTFIRTVSICLVVFATLCPVPAWTAAFQGLGDLAGGALWSSAYAISEDGSTVVGHLGPEAYRWSDSGGMTGLGDVSGGTFYKRCANGVSADGSVIVGQCESESGSSGFRWTASDGMVEIDESTTIARDISADGSAVIGYGGHESHPEAFRWTAVGGVQWLGDLAGGDSFSDASGVSVDGSVVAGGSYSASGMEAFRWTAAGGMEGLGCLPTGQQYSEATGISGDGSTIVGHSGTEAFRWTAGLGMVGLGILPGMNSSMACDVSADGSVVVGYCGIVGSDARAFLWTQELGIKDLADLLGSAIPSGWTLTFASGVAANGSLVAVVGEGINPSDQTEAWIATMTIPEPASSVALICSLVAAGAVMRRRRA